LFFPKGVGIHKRYVHTGVPGTQVAAPFDQAAKTDAGENPVQPERRSQSDAPCDLFWALKLKSLRVPPNRAE
jgi:hypothetical protein